MGGVIQPRPLLEVDQLTISFEVEHGLFQAVKGISFDVQRGEVLCIVGESGSGKTVTGMAIPRLIPQPPGRVEARRMVFDGMDLQALDVESLRKLRGQRIACIFQEPMTALSPLHRVGDQLVEALRVHESMSVPEAKKVALSWLKKVGIPNPEKRINDYPFQYSGGMRQRVMIAMAMIMKPELIIADEPTTALDVTTQEQIFKLMLDLKDDNTSLLFITHDMGVVWELADRVVVMKDGEIVERGETRSLFASASDPYTQSLLDAVPHIDVAARPESDDGNVLLDIDNLSTWFPVREGILSRVNRWIKAVDGISLSISEGKTVALVGESGSGKSTLGRTLLGLERARAGEIRFRGTSVLEKQGREAMYGNVQVVFQDPFSSMNPRQNIVDLVTEPLAELKKMNRMERDAAAIDLLKEVGMDPDSRHRFPHEFSGGQRQRICIARSLSVRPALIVCDEAVSALDVTLQAQVVDLLMDLQNRHGIAYLFISHDLSLVKRMADYVVVMKEGKVVEEGHPLQVIDQPQHPYTQALIEAVPKVGQQRKWRND